MTDDLDDVARGEADPQHNDPQEQAYADRPEQGQGDLRNEPDDVSALDPPE